MRYNIEFCFFFKLQLLFNFIWNSHFVIWYSRQICFSVNWSNHNGILQHHVGTTPRIYRYFQILVIEIQLTSLYIDFHWRWTFFLFHFERNKVQWCRSATNPTAQWISVGASICLGTLQGYGRSNNFNFAWRNHSTIN